MTKTDGSFLGKWLGRLFQLCIIGGVIGGALYVGSYWLKNKPQAHRRRRKRKVSLVTVYGIKPQPASIRVKALGNVVPARKVVVASLVSGSVKWVHQNFAPGGYFSANETILEIDPGQYIYTYAIRKSEWDKAKADLSLEMGRKSVAEQELKSLPNVAGANRSLILRKPQEAKIKANLASARAGAGRAWLDVNRTKLKVPFNSMLLNKEVDLGGKLSPGKSCGTLVGTDRFWVELLLPKEKLSLFRIPGFNAPLGSKVVLRDSKTWGQVETREGTVLRLLPDLDPVSKLARVLVVVTDPLDLQRVPGTRRPLLLGSVIKAEIYGRSVKNVYRIKRTWEHNGTLWFVSPGGKLEVRAMEPLWRDKEWLYYTKGLTPGEQLITSNLGFVVNGMPVRVGGGRPQKRGTMAGGPR